MSWKSLITASLLCVLASPAFAVGPNMALAPNGSLANGHLDANGNWAWGVSVTPDYSIVTGGTGTPVAVELGFTSSTSGETANANPQQALQGNVLSVANANIGDYNGTSTGTIP